jgi:hypothetical protein
MSQQIAGSLVVQEMVGLDAVPMWDGEIGTFDTFDALGWDLYFGGYQHGITVAQVCEVEDAADELPEGVNDPPFPSVWPYSTGDLYGKDAMTKDLVLYRGDQFLFQVQVILNGEPVDITGGRLYFTAKWSTNEADNATGTIRKYSPANGITITQPTLGKATIQLDSADTANQYIPYTECSLYYDVKYIDTNSYPHTVLSGGLRILPNVGRTLS